MSEHFPPGIGGERKPLLNATQKSGSSFRLDGDSQVLHQVPPRKSSLDEREQATMSSADRAGPNASGQPSSAPQLDSATTPRFSGFNLLNTPKSWMFRRTYRPTVSEQRAAGQGYRTTFIPSRYSIRSKIFLLSCYFLALLWTCTVLFGPLILHFRPRDAWCPYSDEEDGLKTLDDDTAKSRELFASMDRQMMLDRRALKASGDSGSGGKSVYDFGGRFNSEIPMDEKEYENPDFNTDPCRYIRLPALLGLTLEECDMCRRMLTAVILGGIIGYERRSADRPAGIRTLGLVSLGACFFTISSISAFSSSTMGWDSSRVTAALPSGVGFLGAALIWKGTIQGGDGQETHQVHGLTTAAGVWLSAAIGVGAGGALYFVSVYSTALILLVLRYGPRLYLQNDEEDEDEEEAAAAYEEARLQAAAASNQEGEDTGTDGAAVETEETSLLSGAASAAAHGTVEGEEYTTPITSSAAPAPSATSTATEGLQNRLYKTKSARLHSNPTYIG